MPRKGAARPLVARRPAMLAAVAVAALALSGCADDRTGDTTPDTEASVGSGDADASTPEDRFPDVEAVELTPTGDRTFDVTVTMSSPYDTPEQYADGWRVLSDGGVELGAHELLHDHAGEQPFTRVQTGVVIPAGIEQVTVEGRDLVNGYGGGTLTVPVPG